jgi:ubiquinone/menaquinone biosynthesis C-methylase UbiE
VLEHIPDYERAVSEIARVTRKGALITVPDVSAIPALHKHGVIPWHLLEATHVNFFTQESLAALLGRSFGRLEFYRICPVEVNGTTFWVSVAALARHE